MQHQYLFCAVASCFSSGLLVAFRLLAEDIELLAVVKCLKLVRLDGGRFGLAWLLRFPFRHTYRCSGLRGAFVTEVPWTKDFPIKVAEQPGLRSREQLMSVTDTYEYFFSLSLSLSPSASLLAMKAIIVGGSIGGLSAAASLLRNGFRHEDIVVLERAAKIIPAGAVRALY